MMIDKRIVIDEIITELRQIAREIAVFENELEVIQRYVAHRQKGAERTQIGKDLLVAALERGNNHKQQWERKKEEQEDEREYILKRLL